MYKQLPKRFKSYLSLYYIDSDFIMSALLSSWIFRGTLRQFLTSENSKSSSKMDKSTLHMGKSMGKSSSQWKILIKNGQIHIANGKINGKIIITMENPHQKWTNPHCKWEILIYCKPGRCFMLPGLSSQRLFLGPSTGLWGTIIHFHHVFQLPTPQVDMDFWPRDSEGMERIYS